MVLNFHERHVIKMLDWQCDPDGDTFIWTADVFLSNGEALISFRVGQVADLSWYFTWSTVGSTNIENGSYDTHKLAIAAANRCYLGLLGGVLE